MKYLKEYWRIIKIYLPLHKIIVKIWAYISVIFLLSVFVFQNSILDKIENGIVAMLSLLFLDIITALLSPVVLFYKVRKQTRKLLDQKLPNNWRVKSFEFDCEGMYFWDVEKINKLKVQNEKSIPTST